MAEPLSFVEAIVARIDGPMSFRMVVQPAIALFFAFRDGRRDARGGRPPFFWALFRDPAHRRELLQNGWKSVGKVFVIAVILDLIFQYLAFDTFRPVGALLAGIVLAIVPYVALRGPVNRVWAHKGDEQ